MQFNYTLTVNDCLNFLKSNISKTKYFIIELIANIATFILLLCLFYNVFSNDIFYFKILLVIILIIILLLKKVIILSHCRKFKISPQNSSFIANSNIYFELNCFDDINQSNIYLKTDYESFIVPLTKITHIFLSSDFIFITNSVSKDILIPTNIFKSDLDKNNFLNCFNASLLTVKFPSNYKFV